MKVIMYEIRNMAKEYFTIQMALNMMVSINC